MSGPKQPAAPRPLSPVAADAGRALFAELDALAARGRSVPCQISHQSHWWTSEDPEALELAAQLCREHCPVRVRGLCREYADRAGAMWGTWGGGVRMRPRKVDIEGVDDEPPEPRHLMGSQVVSLLDPTLTRAHARADRPRSQIRTQTRRKRAEVSPITAGI